MDKMKIQEIADEVADDMGYDFADLTPKMQIKIYNIAMDQYQDMLADAADMSRKNEASGGMMRANYARGSEDDIPEQEDMPMEEFEDIKKMLGVPMDQASGIKSLKNKMASEPSLGDTRNDISLMLFGKTLDELDEIELIQLEEYLSDQAKRKAPSIKMAEGYSPGDYDPMIVEEYEKYKFDAEEQGQPLMSIDDFLRMARAGAMNGGIMRNMYNIGGGAKEYGPYEDVLPQTYSDPITARIESEKKDRAVLKDIKRAEYPVKKTSKKIDLDVKKIQELIEKAKKEKASRAKGGIAGVL